MALGIVKWFNTTKGYGFITPDEGERDVFVHVSAVEKAGYDGLKEGRRLEFELFQRGDGRTSASGLRYLDEEPSEVEDENEEPEEDSIEETQEVE